jgi:hypothetical protein
MARGYLIFGDIEGKLDMLRVASLTCCASNAGAADGRDATTFAG